LQVRPCDRAYQDAVERPVLRSSGPKNGFPGRQYPDPLRGKGHQNRFPITPRIVSMREVSSSYSQCLLMSDQLTLMLDALITSHQVSRSLATNCANSLGVVVSTSRPFEPSNFCSFPVA